VSSILGAIVRTHPASLEVVTSRLQGLAGVEVAMNPGDGRLVVLLEDGDGDFERGPAHDAERDPDREPDPGRDADRHPNYLSAERTLAQISQWSEVLSTSLVYEHSEPDPDSSLKEHPHAS
jgi:nitrate reductase NapAB chaperone NapD